MVLLDVMMPGLDGPATLREIRKLPEFTTTPVVFMTAKAQRHEIEDISVPGTIGVVTKPFDPSTLSDQIKNIWGHFSEAPPTITN